MLRAAGHVRLAASASDLFILDTALDRYLGLPGAIREDGLPVAGKAWRLDPDAAAALSDAGLLDTSEGEVAATLAVPTRFVERAAPRGGRPSVKQTFDLLRATAVAGLRIRRGESGRHVQDRSPMDRALDEDRLRRLMTRLDALRLLIPTPRRCLPSALVTCLWLKHQGVAAEIVFGVRSHPFEAHCWAEHAGVALDDDLDRIRGYTPIAVVAP